MTTPLVLGDLFSGIGGFSYAASWYGWRTAWFSEVNPFACAVLEARFPGVPNHGDITRIDFRQVAPVDVLVGGFPCQDISNAGKRAGIKGDRSGLWKEYARAIRVLRPQFVVVENVSSLTRRGLDVVLGDLAEIGYDAEWGCFRASDIGAPHHRDRWWLLGWRPYQTIEECVPCADCGDPWCRLHAQHYYDCVCTGADERFMGHPYGERQPAMLRGGCAEGSRSPAPTGAVDAMDTGGKHDLGNVITRADAAKWWIPEPAMGGRPHGVSTAVAAWERGLPRVVAKSEQHRHELMALGNSIVPQCAAVLFDRIVAIIQERAKIEPI